MDSLEKAISSIHNRLSNEELKPILLTFFRDRAIEIIAELDERGLMLEDDLKIGGTD